MKNHYKFWIIISLVIVFAAGVAGGIILERNFIDKKPKRISKRRNHVRFPTLDTMSQELSLTAEQQEQIREIFTNNEEKFKNLRSQMRKQLSYMRSLLKSDIKEVLTDDQNSKFEAMIEKYLSQRRKESDERKKRHNKINKEIKGET
ncbi:MAG: Spy/CpxP family protein refolding chaperone [Candidatus Aminicenantaceae bacterium]